MRPAVALSTGLNNQLAGRHLRESLNIREHREGAEYIDDSDDNHERDEGGAQLHVPHSEHTPSLPRMS